MNKNKKGFTLVELIAVIVILILLMIIAINMVNKYMESTKVNAFIKEANTFAKGAMSKEAVDKDSELYADDVFHNTTYGKVCYSITQNSLKKYVTKTENTYRGSVEVCYGLDCTYTTKIWITDGKHYIDGLTDPSDQNQVTGSFSTEFPESCGVDAIGGGTGGDLTVADFDFTGGEQEFLVLKDGVYSLEAWGAQGGTTNAQYPGGYGAYAYAEVNLKKGDKLYVNVGEQGGVKCDDVNSPDCKHAYNGGFKPGTINSGGGGATHIATKSGQIFENLPLTVFYIVAGGGGGGVGSDGWSLVTKNAGAYCNYYSVYQDRWTCQGGRYGANNPNVGNYYGAGGGIYSVSDRTDMNGWFAPGGLSYAHNPKNHNASLYCYNCKVRDDQEANDKSYLTTEVSEEPVSQAAKIGNGFARIKYIGTYTE